MTPDITVVAGLYPLFCFRPQLLISHLYLIIFAKLSVQMELLHNFVEAV